MQRYLSHLEEILSEIQISARVLSRQELDSHCTRARLLGASLGERSDRCLADDSSGRRKRRIFPSLKTLSIVSMMFPDFETYQYLINGCPVLEDLSLHFHEKTFPPNWSGGVLCPSVKRMNIYHYFPSYRETHEGITNITTLHLSPNSLEVLHFCCKSMPVFHNLLTLSFESNKKRGWQVVPLLITNSPNLETLTIKT
ncbi:unnamed protein product [Thlaspi arvense]|uniref:Uncharacterized protein n=1 Tax=Thlaspi arvense TaxID=13288 RepID=A0AAU9SC47_THLAR|nr:unnamed protein product [Thlaspi arvense]